jgi:hypothetical protein
MKPREVKISGFPVKLFYEPLNGEQTFKYVAAQNAKQPAEQARLFAELLMETVKLEDGKPAFELVAGGPNPVDVLTKKTPPTIFGAMIKQLGRDTPVKQAEDVGKK